MFPPTWTKHVLSKAPVETHSRESSAISVKFTCALTISNRLAFPAMLSSGVTSTSCRSMIKVNPRPRALEHPRCHANPTAPVTISPRRTLRKLRTTAARHQIAADGTTIANSSCWLFTPFKYLQSYAPSSVAGEPSHPYLSHLILPHKSISPVNLSTP